ncbi:bifunctional hydroxymethylpyrimidine kinase/phosphomethylpyrimidine kinase [uncultured Anaeromusa sp.]|uniref:bifunctional hydroxymethylpyrimidine kinase/phosphomethylpyrimidine kinase n=1 Tax=uncultured Anaeromusa sp. TaxID=673273 RepID=UPI0029C8B243|nr:bifunctional hydroxymethylpyrimidine kinase/phosphomethylpyrimidine kinase [uncultured Anaeromusa sp.]
MNTVIPTALTVAGSDSGGGAGIQADLKAFAACGVYGMSVLTAITAQNTCGVTAVRDLDAEIIAAQMRAVFDDIPVGAVKIGMLSSAAIIEVVEEQLKRYQVQPVVLDTVMISKHGAALLQAEAVGALKSKLLPLATIVTPNLHEASVLASMDVENETAMREAAKRIQAMGPRYVVVKGGHLEGNPCDVLYDGKDYRVFHNPRLPRIHTHGTGCTFSSAIAAFLARGWAIPEAVGEAKRYITMAIEHGFSLGQGVGPTHHFYELYQAAFGAEWGGKYGKSAIVR